MLQKPKMEELVFRLTEIQVGLKHSLAELQEKLAGYDSTPEMLVSLENAKRDAEDKASNLEEEVKLLREELKAIRDLLGLGRRKNKPVVSGIYTVIFLSSLTA